MDVSVFHKLLISAIQKNASDVHLQAGYPPLMRVNGELLEVKYHPLAPEETLEVAQEILSHTFRTEKLDALSELDVSYGIEGQGRFRVNLFRQRGSISIVLRVIPISIRSFQELHLPPVLEQIAALRRGLVLVVGATGNGKSTTLASLVEHMNQTRRCHILTIEDPIEFLFRHKMSVISQRELGSDTPSFGRALQSALRQDPDVILIGEMRDAETVEIALKAAETGHLVLSSLHTTDAVKTIARLIGFCPPEQEGTVRGRLADSLMAVISLRLLPMKGVLGRIPAVEVLRVTRTIQECIRDPSKTGDIPSHMAKGSEIYGMQTFDQHLLALVKEGKVDLDVAKLASTNPAELERALMLEG
jgi:twitching motility protein PilT